MASTRSDIERVLRLYFDALQSHDGSNVPMSPDVVFYTPDGTEYHGPVEVRNHFTEISFQKVTPEHVLIDGDQAAAVFDTEGTRGRMRIMDYFKFDDGLLLEVRPFINRG